jgi:hypothetical protein
MPSRRYQVRRIMHYQFTFDGDLVEVCNHYELTIKELARLMGSYEAANSLISSGSHETWRLSDF